MYVEKKRKQKNKKEKFKEVGRRSGTIFKTEKEEKRKITNNKEKTKVKSRI